MSCYDNTSKSCCPPKAPQGPPKPDPPSCCEPSSCCSPSVALVDEAAIHASVQQYYGEELKTSDDLKTSACKTCISPPTEIRQLLKEVPLEVTSKFYGCGTPLPLGIEGLRVLDLGCGSGRDCFVAARLVGAEGSVTGIDMTESQLSVARANLHAYSREVCGYSKPNMTFILGEIEKLDKSGLADESQDVVISNCVINLSPDKPSVLREVYRVLGKGGEMYFSDVYCDRRVPDEVRRHPIMIGECLGGALYLHDFFSICKQVGFGDPRVLASEPISIDDKELKKVAGDAVFLSVTFRLFKIEGLDENAEDYGQFLTYKGTITGHGSSYQLDDEFNFVKDEPLAVDANTAAIIIGSCHLSPHFDLTQAIKGVHRGPWKSIDKTTKLLSSTAASEVKASGGGCCGDSGGCC